MRYNVGQTKRKLSANPKEPTMKKLLAILFCVAFAAGAADARTLYVNAKRPNNNGNGLKPSTAKKTIQAAINIARKGDTILVYPGTYRPIETNNKKIAIKSLKGRAKTKIVPPAKDQWGWTLAYLAKSSYPGKGTNTKLSGFLLDGRKNTTDYNVDQTGIWGGQITSCTIQRLAGYENSYPAVNARLTSCIVSHNGYSVTAGCGLLAGCTLQRCIIQANEGGSGDPRIGAIDGCKLYNCLVTGNTCGGDYGGPIFASSLLINCTVQGNAIVPDYLSCEAVHDVIISDFLARLLFSRRSKFYNCILRNNTNLPGKKRFYIMESGHWDEHGNWIEVEKEVEIPAEIHNVDAGNLYSRTFKNNEDPKFANEKKGDYRLRKGSPCINKGKLTAAQKKLVGTKDLAGKKRIRGKAIDMGCYEY